VLSRCCLRISPVQATGARGSKAAADQPGYNNASYRGEGHGTFGYLGEQCPRHELGQGDNSLTGQLKLGADGPATGAVNSALCGNS
jgi:hypothetical protein